MSRPGAKPPPQTVIEAVRVDGADDLDGFTYTVLIDAPAAKPAPRADGDRRAAPRRRTRLRSGKIVDAGDRFVTECLVHDLSESGMRLRLPVGMSLPARFQVYDDQAGRLKRAELSWRRGDEAGIRFVAGEDTARSDIIAADMRRKFYKMPR